MARKKGITYIHGVNRPEIVQDGTIIPIIKRAKGGSLPRRRFLYYGAMTEGELELALMREQLELLQAYYEDTNGVFQTAINLIDYNKKIGLHQGRGAGQFTGVIPTELQFVASRIKKATRKYNASANHLVTFENTQRTGINMGGFDPNDFDASLINQLDCGQFIDRDDDGRIVIDEPEYSNCLQQNQYIGVLNDSFGDSAHHFLYEYITSNEANIEGGTIAAKRTRHALFFDKLNQITSISRANLKLWGFNGVMRHNAKEGDTPYTPIESLEVLKGEAYRKAGVSINLDPVTAALLIKSLPAILSALAGCIGAVALVLKELNRKAEIEAAVEGIGLANFNALSDDFLVDEDGEGDGGGGSTGGGESNLLPFALLGLGGLLLASQDSE